MKIVKRILSGLLILVILAAVAGFAFIRHMGHRALPDYNHDLPLKGLHAPVEVYRDNYAIPHIYADDEHDLYLAVGYIMAEDRLWQMDMLRHVTEGRLSEILGKSFVDTDLLLRALRFQEKSEKILAQTEPSTREALDAFAEGVNQYMENNKRKLPPEFGILRYKPEKWEPCHSLNMVGYMAWDLKAGWSEIILSALQKSIDSVRYQQLLPDLLRSQPAVFPGKKTKISTSVLLPDMMLKLATLKDIGADVLEASNNWAVSGSKSTTGMPLLANDMHLSLSAPGIWYQMHQVVKGKYNVTGLGLPCTPLIICGHNDSIAWGMTNTYVDNLDFYEEIVNPQDSGQYRYNGEWRDFDIRKVLIRTSAGEEIEKTLRFSHRGPVVSSFKKIPDRVVTMHWAGDEMSDEFRTIMLLNRADNWNDFTSALKTFQSISQNVVYADRKGNIGLYCAAGVPLRKRDIPFGVLPGDTDEYDWKGYVPFEELPYLFNPVNGYVASANNRTAAPDYPYHIGSWYQPPDRFERIVELLSAKEILSVEDFKSIQLDQKSKMADRYMPYILSALGGMKDMNPVESKAYEILKNWDHSMAAQNAAAAIFETLYTEFVRCIFSDELGSELYGSYSGVSSLYRNATDQLLISRRNSEWFDDVSTLQSIENFNDRVACAFSKAVSFIATTQGNNPETWQWGNMHHLVLAHPMATVKVLDKVFKLKRGPFAVGGSFHTVSPFSYDNNKPFEVNHGSSHRHIYDLSNWDNSLTVIPTGNSGIPASKHYCDQTELYLNGQYHADYFSKEKVAENAVYKMKFY
ncbi:MAG: penicillin acylase family protein [Bacteroidales bacterium]|nr:penicillin acylase family protein [Bacteroidales bacterium]